ncbi:glycosyltransferase family 2 protein [Pseudophaeobacter arcticus]|jgi:cellulose synthase (UDP-forming)|uniref:glycosyltransferase family 2 protein n=1 Tax=Pseudophaeobacter arcticus TaxID=385492 RepID=UPI0039E26ABF
MFAALDLTNRAGRASPYLAPLFTGWTARRYDLLIAVWAMTAIWFWAWWFLPEHMTTGPQYLIASIALGWLAYLQVFFIVIFRQAKIPAGEAPHPGSVRVAIIVTKTPSEPFSVLKVTLEAMLAQTYPCDVWLADEDPQPATIAWCEARAVRISTRHGCAAYHQAVWPRRTRCKEGNLAYFYDHFGYDEYDFVSQLDSDHVPEPAYLAHIMRGFADPKVGYVSAPSICSSNAKQSWAARTRLHTEAAFHGIFQAGYTSALAPMCIGSHYAVRTKALRAVGGLGPELAEDHSTTMVMNAGGWRGVHALDAIAVGDGPANVSDLCIQEFQWSRSLFTLLLQYTHRYYRDLPARLKFQFLFCQMLYPLMAFFMLLLYALPIAALLFDVRYAEVTYAGFVIHAAPQIIVLTLIAWFIRRDGHFRPYDGKIISWERILFVGIQWPWVAWGCMMALRDRITGEFVDFRITPKGEAAEARLPMRLVLVYAALAMGCFLPILIVNHVENAQGFYLLSAINGIFYTMIVAVIVTQHFRGTGLIRSGLSVTDVMKVSVPLILVGAGMTSVSARGLESIASLSDGLQPYRVVREVYSVSGAGMGGADNVVFIFDPGWIVAERKNPKD